MLLFEKYWIDRLKLKFKTKGFKGLLISLVSFINKNINPKHVGEFPFKYLFLKKRRLIKNFVKKELHTLDDINIINITQKGKFLDCCNKEFYVSNKKLKKIK